MFRLSWVALLVFALDQLTKWLAVAYLKGATITLIPVLKLVLVYNRGAAFGFLDDLPGWQNGLFIAIAIIVSLIILQMIRQLERADLQVRIALWAVLGGAIGNLLDRIRIGAVVDFIQVSPYFPVFNIADSAITVGAALLILDALGIKLFKKQRYDRH
jgi:signal peptidase II